MSIVITKIICSIMISIVGLISVKNINMSELNLKSLKNILLICSLIICTSVLYNMEYTKISSILIYIITFIIFRYILNISYTKSMISCGILFFIMMLIDFIIGVLLVPLLSLTPSEIRNTWYIGILSNIISDTLILLIFCNKNVKQSLSNIIDKLKDKRTTKIIIFFVLLVVIVNLVLYSISNNIKLDKLFSYNILIMIILFLLVLILVQERTNYDRLTDEYDNLFNYVKVFEDWIENEQLVRHEYKNQLAVLRCMTKEKKVKEKIDSIIKENINIDSEMITELKNLPNGGFKGLLYYKISQAKNNNLKVEVDVSIGVEKYLNILDEEKLKTLSKLIGIYFDNAIEAAMGTKNKLVSLEIYQYDKKVSIVISNSFNNKIDISDRYEKGKSTKGEGRGNGLYFSRKLLSKNKWIEEKQDIINDLYVEKIKISSTK